MTSKRLLALALACAGALAVTVATADDAEAKRKRCVYMAWSDIDGRMVADGWGYSYKKS